MSHFKIAPSFTNDDCHIILDLETLSLEPNAHIIQIGAVFYHKSIDDFEEKYGFNEYIDPTVASHYCRHVDDSTLAWWDVQAPEVRKQVFSGTQTPKQAVEKFLLWAQTCIKEVGSGTLKDVKWWGNGPEFDCVVLNDLVQWLGFTELNFRNYHSVRTAEAFLPSQSKDMLLTSIQHTNPEAKPHDAFQDAQWQAMNVIAFLELLAQIQAMQAARK